MYKTEVEMEVLSVIEDRWKKGRETYGEGIKANQNPNTIAWLTEAIEECADQLQYLVAAKIALQKREKDGSY